MKTEVYSWRLSPDLKLGLEREARRRKLSLSAVLDLAAQDWLSKSGADNEGDEEQQRLQRAAADSFAAFESSVDNRSETVREVVQRRLRQKRAR